MVTQPPGTPDNSADGETRVAGDTPAPPDALLGGKYRVERVIGEGAFGRVYLATDTRLRRPVAVKELLATRNATDPELFQRYLDRFGREARAGGAITHPNVVTVYELEIDNHQNTYLVMEYVDGMNLAALLSQVGNLPVERVIAIALDVARGLAVVNDADVVHRDLKPANIMISRRGGAKVGDFGIAQVGTESQRTQVVVGHPGTPLYMSPEQASGFGYLDGRSDLYSLGLVIYEMLAGEPYARRRVPLAQARPETPPALVAIVEKLIQKDPDQRYQSADDVIADLSKLSLAPQRPTAADAYALPGVAPGMYPPGPPIPQGGYAGPVNGVPNAYGGPPSQPPPAPGTYGAPGTPPVPYQQPIGQPPPPPYGTQPYAYAQAPQKRGGISPLAIASIVAAFLILAIGGIALAATHRGGTTATATVPAGTSVASGGATATGVATATSATATSVTGALPTASVGTLAVPTFVVPLTTPQAVPAGTTGAATPGGTAARSSSATSGAVRQGTGFTTVGTAGSSASGSTPFPTASNQVKLTAGKPFPAATGPNVYVDDENRYTLQYPKDWRQAPGDKDTDVQFTFQGTTIAGVTTSDLNGDTKPTAQELADQVNGTFAKQLTNFKLTDATQVKVAGQDGVRMLYTFTDKNNTVALGGYLVTYATDQTVVLFSCYATKDMFDSRVPTFDTVAGSFTGGLTLDNTYTDPQSRFTFDYPKAWSEKKSNSPAVAALVAPTDGSPSFNVVIGATTSTLQQYYDANIKTIADPTSGFKSYKKISESDTTIGGQPAKVQVYTADALGDGTINEFHQWYIVANGKGYVLTYTVLASKAKDFAGYGPIIANSFTLT
ncbi:MAG: protein kinase domain-containing protein [Thermomicrobiales bacterium]